YGVTSPPSIALNDPHDPIVGAIRRDRWSAARKEELFRRCRAIRKLLLLRIERECLQRIAGAAEINRVVPEGGCTRDAANRIRQSLHDLGVAPRLKVSHVVPIYQIDGAFFSDLHQQMRIGRARLIGNKHGASGANVSIVVIQNLLVPRSEVVTQTNRSAVGQPSEAKYTVAEIGPSVVKP